MAGRQLIVRSPTLRSHCNSMITSFRMGPNSCLRFYIPALPPMTGCIVRAVESFCCKAIWDTCQTPRHTSPADPKLGLFLPSQKQTSKADTSTWGQGTLPKVTVWQCFRPTPVLHGQKFPESHSTHAVSRGQNPRWKMFRETSTLLSPFSCRAGKPLAPSNSKFRASQLNCTDRKISEVSATNLTHDAPGYSVFRDRFLHAAISPAFHPTDPKLCRPLTAPLWGGRLKINLIWQPHRCICSLWAGQEEFHRMQFPPPHPALNNTKGSENTARVCNIGDKLPN